MRQNNSVDRNGKLRAAKIKCSTVLYVSFNLKLHIHLSILTSVPLVPSNENNFPLNSNKGQSLQNFSTWL